MEWREGGKLDEERMRKLGWGDRESYGREEGRYGGQDERERGRGKKRG